MQILLYQKQVTDTKHNITFPKDMIVYRDKTFDAIITKDVKPAISAALANGFKYPLLLTIDDKDYFTKFAHYTKKDGTKGTKTKVVLLSFQEVDQGEFKNRTLDEVVDDIEEEWASSVAKAGIEIEDN